MLGFGSFGGLVLLQRGGGAGLLLPILVIALVVGAIALAVRRARGKPPVSEAFSRGKSISNNRTVIAIGIVIAVIGAALIIISPNLLFVEHIGGGGDIMSGNVGSTQRITDLRNVASFFGVALLVVGGIISAVGFSRPTTSPALTTQPIVSQSVLPKSVELGNTPDEVQSVMGQPDKIINLGARVIHVYNDMKIIYVDGKVSDVELS